MNLPGKSQVKLPGKNKNVSGKNSQVHVKIALPDDSYLVNLPGKSQVKLPRKSKNVSGKSSQVQVKSHYLMKTTW